MISATKWAEASSRNVLPTLAYRRCPLSCPRLLLSSLLWFLLLVQPLSLKYNWRILNNDQASKRGSNLALVTEFAFLATYHGSVFFAFASAAFVDPAIFEEDRFEKDREEVSE